MVPPMDGSAGPEKPTPSQSPAPTPSPSSADARRLRRCVQSKLSWGAPAKLGGGEGGGGGGGAESPPVPAVEVAAEKEGGEEPEKGKRSRRPRKSEAARKSSSNKDSTGLDPDSKDEIILVDESPQKKQRKGKKQDAALKVPKPDRKHCKALEYTEGRRSRQQLNISQNEAVSPEASPVLIDIDLMVPSDTRHANDSFDVLDSQDKAQSIVDLRSEAKLAAEENRRLSSGKKMHPFFSSRKVNKGHGQDALNIEDTGAFCDFERDPTLWPIHVVYQLETAMPIIWSKWLMAKGSSLDTSAADTPEKSVSFFEGLVKPLTIETNCKRMRSDQLAEQSIAECTAPGMGLLSCSDKQSGNKFSFLDVISLDDENILWSNSSCRTNLFDNKHMERILQGSSEAPPKGCQLAYYLWTDKYRPVTAAQVCGNTEHIKFLSEWLEGWDEKGHKKNKQIGVANGNVNDSSFQDESDTDCSEDASGCDNVLLITGPVGSGKSAAVFACAREQGFNIIEVNTSDMRNGAYVRQKFEEATKSHGLEKWSQEEAISQPRNDSLDPVSRTPDRSEYEESLTSTRIEFNGDQQKSHLKYCSSSKLVDEAPKQVINKTLILFEDVDTIFDEDRGFISTILKMVETTKWPIILTSNKRDPSLPQLLDQLVLDFKHPSSAELLSHVDMICKSEGVNITVPQLLHIINACSGDIRRTIMLLQFWYQGKQQYTDRSNKCLSGHFSLDLDAVHSIVPKMLPWDFPCKLSEAVCMEIEKTILSAEEKIKQLELLEFEGLKLQMAAPSTKGRNTTKQRKTKKPKLKCGRSAECNDISPCKNDLDDFHDVPDTPLPSEQQRMRSRRGVVLLSESDNDIAETCTDKDARNTVAEGCLFPQSSKAHDLHDQGVSNAITESGFFPQPSEVHHLHGQGISNAVPEGGFFIQSSEVPYLHGQSISNQFCSPNESKEAFETTTIQNQYESSMTGSILQICDTFMSQDISCVPESSFIVGGQSASISSDDFLSGIVSNDLSEFHNYNTHTESTVPLEDTSNVKDLTDEPHKCMEDVVGKTCEGYMELLGRNEQASCSTAGYQLMDECSRAESIWLLSSRRTDYSCKVEHVQDTWSRLRRRCPVLPHETNNNRAASGALKLASGVSDLISESDIMLTRCYPLTNDILDPFSAPCAEPVDFSWYNRQVEMGSVYAQHALCIFSRNLQDTDDDFIDLSKELLFANTAATSLCKLSSGISGSDGSGNISHLKNATRCVSKRGEEQIHLYESLLPVVPSKLSQSLRGPAFVDYLSSVSKISRLENLRLFEGKATSKQRRCRQTRHYLSSGALSLSSEEVELLAQSGSFSDRR